MSADSTEKRATRHGKQAPALEGDRERALPYPARQEFGRPSVTDRSGGVRDASHPIWLPGLRLFRQQLLAELAQRHGAGKQVPLQIIDPFGPEVVSLTLALHPFRHQRQTEPGRQIDHVVHDMFRERLGTDAGDKGFVES